MAHRLLTLMLLLPLCGCAGVAAEIVMGLSAASSVASIARNVFDVDTSLHQQTPGKTPLKRLMQ